MESVSDYWYNQCLILFPYVWIGAHANFEDANMMLNIIMVGGWHSEKHSFDLCHKKIQINILFFCLIFFWFTSGLFSFQCLQELLAFQPNSPAALPLSGHSPASRLHSGLLFISVSKKTPKTASSASTCFWVAINTIINKLPRNPWDMR